jgi:Dyp-type peroxidase family
MAIDLTRPADDVSIEDQSYWPMFERIQGNILKPHGRNCSWQIFIRFTAPAAACRRWIREDIAPNLFTAQMQYDQGRQPKGTDGGLVTLFFLSAAGYRHLGLDPKRLRSTPFRKGMKDQSDGLSEIIGTDNKDPKPSTWETGFQGEIHAMVAIANDEDKTPRLEAALAALEGQLSGIAEVLCTQKGKVLRRPITVTADPEDFEPIEHFGYFDGISQPLFTHEDIDKYYEKGRGGARGVGWDPGASLDLVLVEDPFAGDPDAFGSYLVYRKLAQDYELFNSRVATCAAALRVDQDLAGAYVVGRFKDGTPVVDSPVAGADYKNDFDFAEEDERGFRCPRHSHIRKVNPRGTTPFTSLEDERSRRIARRGIPYGKPHPDILPDTNDTEAGATERGLLFMCFQASIKKQFEFIQRTWVDNPNFPVSLLNPFAKDTGDDPLIGQDPDETQRWPKEYDNPAAGRRSFNFESAVTLKGGEYMFAPSKPFLEGL